MSQVILPFESFASDAETHLGRANGNTYQRIPGVSGVHDGQIMVRLKKNRFILLDYSIVPTDSDFQAAELQPNVTIPQGAGRTICSTPECTKIGIPVCLWDSEPHAPNSLYLRSGLCFGCQRRLNEQRRSERKRPASAKGEKAMSNDVDSPSLIYAIGPNNKKFKLDGKTIRLRNDAVIINGSVEGINDNEGRSFQEIGADLSALVQEAAQDTQHMVNAPGEFADALYGKVFQTLHRSVFLLSQWKTSWDASNSASHDTLSDANLAEAVSSAMAAAAADGPDQHASMVSLLLAADKGHGHDDITGTEAHAV